MRWTLVTLLLAVGLIAACGPPPPPVTDLLAVAPLPDGKADYPISQSPRPQWTGAWSAAPERQYPGERQTWVFTVRSMDTSGRIIARAGVPIRVRARYFGPRGELPDAGKLAEVVADGGVFPSGADDVAVGLTGADGIFAVDVEIRPAGADGRYKLNEVEVTADEYKVSKDGKSLTLIASIPLVATVPD